MVLAEYGSPGTAVELSRFQVGPEGTSLALGFFDGLHLGHRQVLEHACAVAGKCQPIVFTFSNHPGELVRSGGAPLLLSSFSERLALISQMGLGCVYTRFEPSLARLSSQEFVNNILVQRLHVRKVTVGKNYRFGYQAQGSCEQLRQLGEQYGFSVDVCPYVLMGGKPVSSTRLRQLVAEGQTEQCRQMLGRCYSVSGLVVHGKQRGRTIGIPTANVAVESSRAMPKPGSYVVWAGVEGQLWPGVANFGTNPTFSGSAYTLEVNVGFADGQGNICWNQCPLGAKQTFYDRHMEVFFGPRIRDEIRFETVSALQAQIAKDRQLAWQYCQFPQPRSLLVMGVGDRIGT